MQAHREQVVAYCHRLAASPLSSGTSGNISVADRAAGLVAISPSAMEYMAMTPADVVIVDFNGRPVDGQRRASSELPLHLAAYRAREDISAVCHVHAPAVTTLSVLGWELPAVHYMLALSGSDHIPLVPYHGFGSEALADAAGSALVHCRACILANHGLIAGGSDIAAAWALTEQVEFCAELYLRAKSLGEPRLLDKAQIEDVIARLDAYKPQQ